MLSDDQSLWSFGYYDNIGEEEDGRINCSETEEEEDGKDSGR